MIAMTMDGYPIPKVRQANSVSEAERQVLYFRAARDGLTARLQKVVPFSGEYDRVFADLCEVSDRFRQAVDERLRAKLREPITTFQ